MEWAYYPDTEVFHTQEKELRRLFEYERETEQKNKERNERLRAEGIAHCMTIGKGEIYSILPAQIKELYKTMGRFIEREKNLLNAGLKAMTNIASVSAKI